MPSITSADAVLTMTQAVLFSNPQQIQQFATDDIFDTDTIKSVIAEMGVDGTLSFGYVNVPVMQNYALKANSPSVSFFETVYLFGKQANTVYALNATILLPSLGKKYIMTNGGLTGYKPTPDAKNTLKDMKFQITWESVVPAPVA